MGECLFAVMWQVVVPAGIFWRLAMGDRFSVPFFGGEDENETEKKPPRKGKV